MNMSLRGLSDDIGEQMLLLPPARMLGLVVRNNNVQRRRDGAAGRTYSKQLMLGIYLKGILKPEEAVDISL